jgi:hypothetical protein
MAYMVQDHSRQYSRYERRATASQLAIGAPCCNDAQSAWQIPWSSLGDPTITVAQLLKPFPVSQVSVFIATASITNYNVAGKARAATIARPVVLVSYTRSKLIDETSSVFDASILTGPIANFPADSFNRRLERDLSNGDIPNVFVAGTAYDLPIGKGRRYNPGGIAGAILGGFEVAGGSACSLIPVAVTQVTNFSLCQFGRGGQTEWRINLPLWQATAQFLRLRPSAWPQFTISASSRNRFADHITATLTLP